MEFIIPLLIVMIGLQVVQLYYLRVFRTRQVEIKDKLRPAKETTRTLVADS